MTLSRRLRCAHVITSLDVGGAQKVLVRLLGGLDRDRFDPTVIVLTEGGGLVQQVRDLGIRVECLDMSRHAPDMRGFVRLVRLLRRLRPDVVQTWMYHADLVGGVAARCAGIDRVIWGIRQGELDATMQRSTRAVVRACAFLSRRVPVTIACCSEASRRVHAAAGYASDKLVVIPNGVDTEIFRPDEESRARVRATLEVSDDVLLLGAVGRWDPQKDYETLFKAWHVLAERRDDIELVLCGEGLSFDNALFSELTERLGVKGRVHALGSRDDLSQVYPSFDLLVLSSSYGEGFPNVLIEAMACGVPCVATNVGDSAVIVADTGAIVTRQDPDAMAVECERMLTLPIEHREAQSLAARASIVARYELTEMINRHEQLALRVAAVES